MKYSQELAACFKRGTELAGELAKLTAAIAVEEGKLRTAEQALADIRRRVGDSAAAGAISGAVVLSPTRKDLADAQAAVELAEATLAGMARLLEQKEKAIAGVLGDLEHSYHPWAAGVAQEWVDGVIRPAEKHFHGILAAAGVTVSIPPISVEQIEPARVSKDAGAAAAAIASLRTHQATAAARQRMESLNRQATADFQALRGRRFVVNREFGSERGRWKPGDVVIAGVDVDLKSLEHLTSSFSGWTLKAEVTV